MATEIKLFPNRSGNGESGAFFFEDTEALQNTLKETFLQDLVAKMKDKKNEIWEMKKAKAESENNIIEEVTE